MDFYYSSAFRHRRHCVFGLFVGPSDMFPGISRITHGGTSLKLCMLMYPNILWNWLDYGHGLLILLFFGLFWLSETGQFVFWGHFPKNAWREWPEILPALVSCPLSELIRYWSWSVDVPPSGVTLTFIILVFLWLSETGQISTSQIKIFNAKYSDTLLLYSRSIHALHLYEEE